MVLAYLKRSRIIIAATSGGKRPGCLRIQGIQRWSLPPPLPLVISSAIVPAHIGFLRTPPKGVTITKDGIFFNNAHLLWILVSKLYRRPSLISLQASILVEGLQLERTEFLNRRCAIA